MAPSLIEITKDLILTLVKSGRVSSEDMQDTLQKTHTTLLTLKAQEEMGTTAVVSGVETPPVDWRKSIARHAVTCLECGRTFKQLRRHLQEHGLDGRVYRAKYGIPQTQPLAARDTTVRRRQVVRKTRPWEKAPRFVQAQGHGGKAPPEPEAKALPDELEEPTAAAPAKRERKSAPKKTARKKRSEG